MPEGVHGYPRWQGVLRTFPAFPVVAAQEVRRAWNNPWARGALMLVFAYAVIYLGSLYTLKQSRGDAVHTLENFLRFVDLVRWGALAVAAVMAAPAFLEDQRRGALELYFSRAVTRADYMAGKLLAVLGLATAAVWGPALVYWLGSWAIFDAHPDRWVWVPLEALLYALMWAFVLAGVGIGLSLLTKSSRAAAILLAGGVAVLDVILSSLLVNVTTRTETLVVSPLAALSEQVGWLFGAEAPGNFPWWWGLVALGVLAALGWGVTVWRRPKLQGVD